jgi:hypothetical protein
MGGSPQFTGFYSPLKALGATALLCVLAVVPMLPGVGNHLVYTAFFYTRVGYPLLIVACVIMLLMAVAMLPMIVRGFLGRPAIEISAETVRIWGIPNWRQYPLSCVTQGARRQFGSLLGRCPDGKQFAIPLWLYRRPHEVAAYLTAAGTTGATRETQPVVFWIAATAVLILLAGALLGSLASL